MKLELHWHIDQQGSRNGSEIALKLWQSSSQY